MATAHPTTGAPTPDEVTLRPVDWALLAVPGLVWGSSFYLIAVGLESFHPAFVGWVRIVIGFTVLSTVPRARTRLPADTRATTALLSVTWMALPLSLFAFAEERVSSSITGMMNGLNPVTVVVVGLLAFGLRINTGRIIGLVIGTAGGVLIALPTMGEGSSSIAGIVMILVALTCYGIAINAAGPLQRAHGALPVIRRSLGGAAVLALPTGLWGLTQSTFSWPSAIATGVLGAFGTGLAYVVHLGNTGRLGSTRASTTTYIIPAVSIVLGVVALGEQVAALAVVGSAVALVGAWQVNRST